MRFQIGSLCVAALAAFAGSAGAATYAANGNTGFGGPLGGGSLEITDSLTQIQFKFTRGGGNLNDHIVFYLDTVAGGVTTTSGLSDTADGGRSAISGFPNGQAVVNLPFAADYGMSLEGGFWGAFDIVNSPSNFTYKTGASQGGSSAVDYTLTLNAADAALLGIVLGSGQTFNFAATLTSNSAFRSDEAIGDGVGAGNPGFASAITFSAGRSYTLVPEPATLGLAAVSALGLLARRRRLA